MKVTYISRKEHRNNRCIVLGIIQMPDFRIQCKGGRAWTMLSSRSHNYSTFIEFQSTFSIQDGIKKIRKEPFNLFK